MDKSIDIPVSWNSFKLMSEMVSSILILLSILHLLIIRDASGHGALIEPPMRSVLWKYGFDAPINYNYMELYCGGFQTIQNNGGRCGVCGDPFQGPYENERGGKYDLGIIAKSYPEGTISIEVKVEITAHHKGYIEFKLCPNDEADVTQECLNRYPLTIEQGRQQGDPMKFYPPEGQVIHSMEVSIPPDIRCERCVLQWTYRAGNAWGNNADGKSCLGCGIQETYINCADISVRSHSTIVNTRFKGVDNIPISEQPPSFAEHKHEVGKTPALNQEFNDIAPDDKELNMKVTETRGQLSNNSVPIPPEPQHPLKLKPLHPDKRVPIHTNQMQSNVDATKGIGANHLLHNNATQPGSNPAVSQNDMIIHTRKGVTQAHLQSLPEQRIPASAKATIKTSHPQIRTPILNSAQPINLMQNPVDQGHSLVGQEQIQRFSPNNAHFFPVNKAPMANTVHTQLFGMPHRIIMGVSPDVQAWMALTSPQIQEFYQRLASVASLNNAHRVNKNLQHVWQTPIERDRPMLEAIHRLHSVVPNTIHREALIRNTILTERQLRMDRRFSH